MYTVNFNCFRIVCKNGITKNIIGKICVKRTTLYNAYTYSNLRAGWKTKGTALFYFRLTYGLSRRKWETHKIIRQTSVPIPIMYYPSIAISFYIIWWTFVRRLWLISFTGLLLSVYDIRIVLWEGSWKGLAEWKWHTLRGLGRYERQIYSS